MLFVFIQAVFSVLLLLAFTVLCLVFIRSKKNKKIKLMISTPLLALSIVFCFFSVPDALVPKVNLTIIKYQTMPNGAQIGVQSAFELNGHQYVEDGTAGMDQLPASSKLVGYSTADNHIINYATADCYYQIGHDDSELYAPDSDNMGPISKYKKAN